MLINGYKWKNMDIHGDKCKLKEKNAGKCKEM